MNSNNIQLINRYLNRQQVIRLLAESFTESEDWLNELTSGVKTKNKEAIDSKAAKTEVLKVDTVSNAKSELNEKDSKSANKFNLDFLDSFGKEANKEATKQSTSDEPHVPRAKHHQLEELKEENAFLTHSIERLKQQHQQELSFVQAAHELAAAYLLLLFSFPFRSDKNTCVFRSVLVDFDSSIFCPAGNV